MKNFIFILLILTSAIYSDNVNSIIYRISGGLYRLDTNNLDNPILLFENIGKISCNNYGDMILKNRNKEWFIINAYDNENITKENIKNDEYAYSFNNSGYISPSGDMVMCVLFQV